MKLSKADQLNEENSDFSKVFKGGLFLSVLFSVNSKMYIGLKQLVIKMRRNLTKVESLLWEKIRNKQLGIKFRQ